MNNVITKDKVTYISVDWIKELHSLSNVNKFFIRSTQFAKVSEKKKIRELDVVSDYLRVEVLDSDAEFVNILGLSVNVLMVILL